MRAFAGVYAATLLVTAAVLACSSADPGSSLIVGGTGRSSGGSNGTNGTSGGAATGGGSSSGSTSSSGGAASGTTGGGGSSSGTGTSTGGSGGASSGGAIADDGGSVAAAGDAGDLEDLCVSTINGYRATIGKPPYTRWTSNEACTSSEAEKDSESGVAHSAFGSCNELGQCECPGWPGPLDTMITGCLAQMWAEGPGGGHYEIMASGSYTMVACGFYTMADGSIWGAQDYQ